MVLIVIFGCKQVPHVRLSIRTPKDSFHAGNLVVYFLFQLLATLEGDRGAGLEVFLLRLSHLDDLVVKFT